MDPEPLRLTLELVRSQNGADRYHSDSTPQQYARRLGPAAYLHSQFPWSQEVADALQALSRRGHHSEEAQKLGDLLRDFLGPLGWAADERDLERALAEGREVHVTLRFAAAELYMLPWELLTLTRSRRHLGAVAGCHLRYEAPRDEGGPPAPYTPPAEKGRLLFAWSAAGGYVPAAEHLAALQHACERAAYPFHPRTDVIEDVSYEALQHALESSSRPVSALHILCHGGPQGQSYGLSWSSANSVEKAHLDAAHLRELLAPHAESLRLVVLCACTSGDAGALGKHLGSVAQGLHAIGIRAVIASRFPLSVDGSESLAATLYERLLVQHQSLQQALEASRKQLKKLSGTLDWATLQLYARPDEPLHQFPFVFRPYQGLLPFERDNRAFFFGRSVEQREWLERLQNASRGERPGLQVLLGPSGSGKSSLARAALLPVLAEEGWEVVARRPVEPGLLDELRRLGASPPRSNRLLLVDQFEELFTRPKEEHEPLARGLWELSRSSEARTVVLLTLRLDALERCAELRLDDEGTRLSTVLLDSKHHQALPPLQDRQYREVIEEPAKQAGLSFDPGLVDQLVRDAGQEPGALPLLEHALDLLWERRQHHELKQDAYRNLGRLTGVLTQTVDTLYEKLAPAEQRQLRRLLVALVDFRDDQAPVTRRRESVERLRPVEPEARAAFDAVVERLVAQRLLVRGAMSEPHSPGDWLELAHEALIRHWKRLGQWIQEDRERELALRALRAWAQEWLKHRDAPDGGAGYLPTGGRLAQFRELREKYPEDTRRAPEREFLDAAEGADRQRDERFLESVRIANRLLTGIRGLEGRMGMEVHRRALLEQVEWMLDHLIESAGTSPLALRARAAAFHELGDVALENEDWDEARKLYAYSLRIVRELYAQAPSDAAVRQELLRCHDKLGALTELLGELAQALEHREQALRLAEKLREERPEDLRLQLELAHARQRSGEVLARSRTNADLAQTRLEGALALLQQLSSIDGFAPKLQLQWASCLSSLGEIEAARGRFDTAEGHHHAALEVLQHLPADPRAGTQARRMFAHLYVKLGGLAFDRQDTTEAFRRYVHAHNLLEALAEAEPRSTPIQRELASCWRSLGEVNIAMGDLSSAQGFLHDARNALETLVPRFPAHTELLVELLRTELDLGSIARASGDRSALATHEASAARLLAAAGQLALPDEVTHSLSTKLKALREP